MKMFPPHPQSSIPTVQPLKRVFIFGGLLIVFMGISYFIIPHPSQEPRASELTTQPSSSSSTVAFPYAPVLLLVIGGGGLSLALYLKKRQPERTPSTDTLSVMHELSLSPTHRLVLVQCQGERLLLGLSPEGFDVLGTFPAASDRTFHHLLQEEINQPAANEA